MITTPFGRPVVPEVKTMSEGDVPVRAAVRARTSPSPVPSPPARKSFQVRKSAGASSASTTTCSRCGRPGRGPFPGPSPAARRSDATYDVPRNVPVTNSSFARLLSSTYAASVPLNRVLSGTSTAPAVTAPSAETIQSRVFGAQIATRSPTPTPFAMQAAAARSTRAPSSAYEIRARPSTTASTSPWRSAALRTRPAMQPHSMSPRTATSWNMNSERVADCPSD
ncbi:hypothetical protein ADL25_27630 [Streptomyces sp. NRRL F-5122]|nr:hypothetical protein ADL25_27630 [Streptomyces sp. NRRL F-5122]